MKYVLSALVIMFISFNCTEQKEQVSVKGPSITGKEVTYTANGTTLKGYLAYDENLEGRRPGVIVVHEWWGHNQYARHRAEMLAELGYIALAIDMYGDGKQVSHPDDAGKLAMETMSNMETAKARFDAGIDFLKKQPQNDPEKIAAIGYCFGGGVVLNMVLAGSDLDAGVSFHGSLPQTVENPDLVKAKILVCNGADDPFVPRQQVEKFESEMKTSGIDYKLVNYPGARHAFTNPEADSSSKKFNLPLAYNKKADEESWEEMKSFLKEVFK